MRRAVIVDAVRTCIGARSGALNSWHAVDLLAYSFESLIDRLELDPASIDHVVGACRTTVGEQAMNVTSNAVLANGWTHYPAAITVEGGTTGGFSAFESAVALIESGRADVVLVGGVESPSHVGAGASIGIATGRPFGPRVHARYADVGGLLAPSGIAERMASHFGIGRVEMDAWFDESRARARSSTSSEETKQYLLPLPVRSDRATEMDRWLHVDEMIERELDASALKPLFETDGTITAANMAQPADGSAALILMADDAARRMSRSALAQVSSVVIRGSGALDGDSGLEVAVAAVGARSGLKKINSINIHEDFAVSVLAFEMESGVSRRSVNSGGGALATGDTGGAAALSLLVASAAAVSRTGDESLSLVAGACDSSGAVLLTR